MGVIFFTRLKKSTLLPAASFLSPPNATPFFFSFAAP